MRLGVFSHHRNPCRFLQPEGLRLYFPRWSMGCTISLAPQLFLPVYLHACVGSLSLPATTLPASVHQLPPCPESSPPLLIVSASPTTLNECFFFNSWVSNFHTVRFPGSSGYFLFLNLLLSFFSLGEEASISTYTSILAKSNPNFVFRMSIYTYKTWRKLYQHIYKGIIHYSYFLLYCFL